MLTTSFDTLTGHDGRSLVIVLGEPLTDPGPLENGRLDFRRFDEAEFEALRQLPPSILRHGVHFLVATAALTTHGAMLRRMQRHVLCVYIKYVRYPSISVEIPDEAGVRPQNPPPNLLSIIRKAENTFLHLRHPLADRLSGLGRGTPLLLLLPGPTLRELGPHLPALQARCLVGTVSRGLEFCQQHGVAPDFLVQLDTLALQGAFFDASVDLSRTILLALSLAPVSSLARRVRAMFFMESFDLGILPSPFRVRESWLSSLLPCLGLAELLRASPVVLAGVDLSFPLDAGRYHNSHAKGAHAAPRSDADRPREPFIDDSRTNELEVYDRSGLLVATTLPYLATATEADEVMRDLSREGMTFRVAGNHGVLDAEVAPGVSVEEMLRWPLLDRAPLMDAVDAVCLPPRELDARRLKVQCLKNLDHWSRNEPLFQALALQPEEAAQHHPIHQALTHFSGNGRLPRLKAGPETLEMGRAMLRHLVEQTRRGLAFASLVLAVQRQQSVALLLDKSDDEAAVLRQLAICRRLRPTPTRFGNQTRPPEAHHQPTVNFTDLFQWLSESVCHLATPAALGTLRRILPWMPMPHVLDTDEAAWFLAAWRD